jgi:hypothetical protein
MCASDVNQGEILTEKMIKELVKVNGVLRRTCKKGGTFSLNLPRVLRLSIPTICTNEYKGSGKKRFRNSEDYHGAKTSEGLRTCEEDPIYLNPSFAEMMMGYPLGWTDLEASETP